MTTRKPMACLLPKAFYENIALATSFQDSRRCSKIPDDAASHGFALLSGHKRTCSAFPVGVDLPCVRVLACSPPPALASKCLPCSSAMSRHATAMQEASPAGNEPLKLVRLTAKRKMILSALDLSFPSFLSLETLYMLKDLFMYVCFEHNSTPRIESMSWCRVLGNWWHRDCHLLMSFCGCDARVESLRQSTATIFVLTPKLLMLTSLIIRDLRPFPKPLCRS